MVDSKRTSDRTRRLLVGLVLATLTVASADAQLDHWEGPAAVAIEVRGDEGKPVEGAMVTFQVADRTPPQGPEPVATDERGRALVSNLGELEWYVEVRHDSFMLYAAYIKLKAGKKPVVGFSSQVNTSDSWTPMRIKFAKAKSEFSKQQTKKERRAERQSSDVERTAEQPRPEARQPAPPVASAPAEPEAAAVAATETQTPSPSPPTTTTPTTDAPRQPAPQATEARQVAPAPEVDDQAAKEAVAAAALVAESEAAQQEAIERAATEEAAAAAAAVIAESEAARQEAAERVAAEQEAADKAAQEQAMVEREAAEREADELAAAELAAQEADAAAALEAERLEADRLEAERLEADRLEAERLAAATTSVDPVEAGPAPETTERVPETAAEQEQALAEAALEREAAERAAAEQLEIDRIEAETQAAEKAAAEQAAAEQAAAEQAEIDRVADEQAAAASVLDEASVPDEAATPAAEPAPAEATPPPPAAPPTPSVSSGPRPIPSYMTSADMGTCPGCQPGEWSMYDQETVASARDIAKVDCPADLDAITEGLSLLVEKVDPTFAGPISAAITPSRYAPVGREDRAEIRQKLGEYLQASSTCRLVGVLLPPGSSFAGYQYEAWGAAGGGACVAGVDCPVGRARWGAEPTFLEGPVTAIYTLFHNRSTRHDRRARFTVYFVPAGPNWAP